ncbi:MAG: hypothetical protein CBE33_07010 [Candidatus Pelagibacter sp. TMED273]|nr:MAG: hypothetical protein CBE33_07010 [Candidatus Pelagibacter sp. TMED273]|tara:strand:- start:1756 stop:2550 length:795 start_codon:yes stop_codon:yes gene_type:complete
MLKKIYKFIRSNAVLEKIFFSNFSKLILKCFEFMVFGGRRRRNLINKIQNLQFNSKYRCDWILSKEPPHFYDFERYENLFVNSTDYHKLLKGYHVENILKKGDKLLDIGTGAGFFVKRFFSNKCSSIDAIDIDETAIQYAKKYNFAENINYVIQDAVNKPFPNKNYNVIVWDGAIGHFPHDTTNKMLNKISNHLTENGFFAGSENLGREEGHDHLQFWDNIEELRDMLKKYFKHIDIKEVQYPIGHNNDFIRREAYWICNNSKI